MMSSFLRVTLSDVVESQVCHLDVCQTLAVEDLRFLSFQAFHMM